MVMADPAADGLCELVRQARAGSNDAATAVYERCRAPLLAVIRGMLAKPLHKIEDADDLLNETFAEIFRGTLSDQALHSPETLLQYMKTVARNNVRNAIRKYLCTQRFNLRAEVPLAAAPAQKASELSPADHAMLAEFLELTDADLAEHSFASAQLITKYLFCGFEVREIAEFLHISQRHVLHLIDKAKQQLSGGGGVNGEVKSF
jgi:RNA polymerase sigma factor (sigma-70 family)